MTNRSVAVSVLAVAAVVAGAAYAADQAETPPTKETPAQVTADKDVWKLSKDGAAAFQDLHMTRIAIFDAEPAQAKTLIAKAEAELAKAKTDDAVFTKAESELKQPPAAANKTAGTPAASTNADAKQPVAWVPIDGQLTLGDDFVATPQKAAAVTDANKSLAGGDQKGAIEKLKLADVNVSFTMAVVPLAKTTSDVDQAASLIDQGKYYEANAVLKQAEDGMRFDMIDLNSVPKAAAKSASTTPAAATGAAAATKPAK